MQKILISGVGGTPTENVVRSWEKSKREETVIGIGSEPFDMMLSSVDIKYQVPYSTEMSYPKRLLEILDKEKPDFAHFQNDIEIRVISRMRENLIKRNIKLFMPSKETVEICVDKSRSATIWMKEGIRVPQTLVINNEKDLKKAFEKLGDDEGNIWLRAMVGGGGKGALPTNCYEFARLWIDRFNGWGNFTAAECLTPQTITWLSIWYEGELVVAQTRKRLSWNFGNRTLSGVTGITRVGMTDSDETVDRVAIDAISSIDKKPHGIYGVDMAYDRNNFPNPTEINISRFFTTVYFFTAAGLNMPEIYKNIALYQDFPTLKQKINPLPNGLLWIRGMDRIPILTTMESIGK